MVYKLSWVLLTTTIISTPISSLQAETLDLVHNCLYDTSIVCAHFSQQRYQENQNADVSESYYKVIQVRASDFETQKDDIMFLDAESYTTQDDMSDAAYGQHGEYRVQAQLWDSNSYVWAFTQRVIDESVKDYFWVGLGTDSHWIQYAYDKKESSHAVSILSNSKAQLWEANIHYGWDYSVLTDTNWSWISSELHWYVKWIYDTIKIKIDTMVRDSWWETEQKHKLQLSHTTDELQAWFIVSEKRAKFSLRTTKPNWFTSFVLWYAKEDEIDSYEARFKKWLQFRDSQLEFEARYDEDETQWSITYKKVF